MNVFSWNRWPKVQHQKVLALHDRFSPLPSVDIPMLAHGNGRSYGDVCLNDGGCVLMTRGLNRFIAFDSATGRLQCEAGVLLKEILDLVVPQGWFLPVTPGTRFVTVAGAISNDVHGKNHHVAGTFGHHVLSLELLRSDGQRILCGPEKAKEWFSATVGGLGLTGLITRVELQLMPVTNAFMWVETRRFHHLDEFWAINEDAEHRWPYTVAWIDCLSGGGKGTRGLFSAGKHAPPQAELPTVVEKQKRVPFLPPFSLVNRVTLSVFNTLYYHQILKNEAEIVHYAPYFYPLDKILEWNRIYGRGGFFQYQCVLSPNSMQAGISALLELIRKSGQGSFLAVLKTFGNKPSLGMLSFPRPGATLALDFPNLGPSTFRLLANLDAVVRDYGGALYPAKDARMSTDMFRNGYPSWEAFKGFIDPGFSSSFWNRVNS